MVYVFVLRVHMHTHVGNTILIRSRAKDIQLKSFLSEEVEILEGMGTN